MAEISHQKDMSQHLLLSANGNWVVSSWSTRGQAEVFELQIDGIYSEGGIACQKQGVFQRKEFVEQG